MFFSDMELKTLAITPPLLLLSSPFFRGGASFGSSKAFHCLLLLSCLLLSSVNTTLHNLPESTVVVVKRFHGFNGEDSNGLETQNVCPVSHFFTLENQFDPGVTFFGLLSCPNKSWSNSGLISDDLSSVVCLSPRPVHIGETNCYKILFRELYVKKNNGDGFMVENQCEGFRFRFRFETWDSIKLLFYYRTDLGLELFWLSGVAVFAVPMKETKPVLLLKKPIFWIRSKKLSIAVLVAAALLILMFSFNDENHKRNVCSSHIDVGEVEKPSSTFTISPQMDSLLKSISKETEIVESEVETSEAMSLSVKTEKDKKRRRNKKKKKKKKKNTDVSSSNNSGNSTPRSPSTTQATTMIIQGSSLAPNVRAPGKKSRTEVKEENVYDIWGDHHLTGLNLMDKFKEVRDGISSGFGEEDECESFFVKGPQRLLADSHARFVSFYNQWG